MDRPAFRRGFRDAVPYAIAGFLVSMSFGVVALDAGLSPLAAILMSAIVFAGAAQFAAISILAAGGGPVAAIAAAGLMNSRYLIMGVTLAPSLPGGKLYRAIQAQPLVDSSWAMSSRGDGTYDRWYLFGASAVQYVTWVSGTIAGVFGGDLVGDPRDLGVDAMFPAFFLALLISEVKGGRAFGVAALGAAAAFALVPVAPPGVPVLVASLAALVGLARR